MTITLPDNINWKLVGADVASALTMVSIIPYDKDTMNLVNQVVPTTMIPWVIKAGIVATIILRLWNRFGKVTPSVSIPAPLPGAVQPTITKP